MRATLGILTKNSAATIERALSSARGFDEVIVCDGGSTDSTREIAAKHGAIIIDQDSRCKNAEGKLIDYAGVRNQIIERASHSWIFMLDSDEQLTPTLLTELAEVTHGTPAAFWVPRKYVWKGQVIEAATTYPNVQMRFFSKSAIDGYRRPVHEKVIIKEGATVATLSQFMLVPIEDDPSALISRWKRYIDIESKHRPSISFRRWVNVALRELRVSLIYLLRLPRVLMNKSRLPISFDIARHRYQFMLIVSLLKSVDRI